jgi:hypothetical protein
MSNYTDFVPAPAAVHATAYDASLTFPSCQDIVQQLEILDPMALPDGHPHMDGVRIFVVRPESGDHPREQVFTGRFLESYGTGFADLNRRHRVGVFLAVYDGHVIAAEMHAQPAWPLPPTAIVAAGSRQTAVWAVTGGLSPTQREAILSKIGGVPLQSVHRGHEGWRILLRMGGFYDRSGAAPQLVTVSTTLTRPRRYSAGEMLTAFA